MEALGALKLLSGGSASLAAVDDLHQATGRDLDLVVAQKDTVVGGNLAKRIQGIRRSVAQRTWLGSESVVLQVLCDLLDLVERMNTQLAAHTHVPCPAPSPADALAFTTLAVESQRLASELRPVTL